MNDPKPPSPPPPAEKGPFRWTERRVARFSTLVVAAAVVVLDIVLFVVFLRTVEPMLQDFPTYRVMIPVGILAVFLFALRRFLSQLRMFREDQ